MSNPPAVADFETFQVTRSVRVNAPQETVWRALTEPEHIGRWFGQAAEFPDGVSTGALGTFGWTDHGEHPVRIEQYEPVTAFAFTWGTPEQEIREDNSTTASFTLAPDPASSDATVVTVTETGFDTLGDVATRRAAMEDNTQGWTQELDELVAYAEALATAGAGR